MNHWTERVERVLKSSSGDLRELAKIAGYDPKEFYIGQSLAGCDLRGQDLRGMIFEGCDLEKAILDRSTRIDEVFDPRVDKTGVKLVSIKIPTDLNGLILNYMTEKKIRIIEEATMKLVNGGLMALYGGRFEFYCDIIEKNRHLKNLISRNAKKSDPTLVYGIDWSGYLEIMKSFSPNDEQNVFRVILMVGLLKNRIRANSKKDYSNLSPHAFYPPKLIKVEGRLT